MWGAILLQESKMWNILRIKKRIKGPSKSENIEKTETKQANKSLGVIKRRWTSKGKSLE